MEISSDEDKDGCGDIADKENETQKTKRKRPRRKNNQSGKP